MAYRLLANGFVQREDGAVVPADPANVDWQQYQAWKAAGNAPEPYAAPAAQVPQTVTRFQARAALLGAGLLDQVEALMAGPQTSTLARLAWQDALEFKRTSPTLLTIAASLGLDAAALDALFTQAAAIEA